MIMATMPDRKSTIIRLLMIENQWIWSSIISRYVSHREAHLTSLGCTDILYRQSLTPDCEHFSKAFSRYASQNKELCETALTCAGKAKTRDGSAEHMS